MHTKISGVDTKNVVRSNVCSGLKIRGDVFFQVSLKCLAFNVLTTPDNATGKSRLQSACIEGDVETFGAILNNSPDKLDSVIALQVKISKNSSHFPGKSLWAVLNLQQSAKHKRICELVETVSKDFRSQSLLHLAARKGQVHHIRRLLDQCGEQVNSVRNDWWGQREAPLVLAARFNDEDVVEYLVKRGASLEMKDVNQCTPFHHAAGGGKVRNMLRLIENGADIFQRDIKGQSAFHLAAANGHTEAMRLLLEHGADVNEVTLPFGDIGYTPFMLAAERGHLETIQFLIKNGGQLNKGNENGWLPLHSAAAGDHTAVVQFLLENGGHVLAKTAQGTTVLHLAIQLELVTFLVEKGADIHARDNCRKTPLHVVAEKGQTDTINYLLSQGADVNSRDKDGLLALYYALKEGHATTANVLMDKGSNAMLTNDESLSEIYETDLLQSSARKGSTAVLQLLLKRGLSADALHSDSVPLRTPLEEAASTGQCEAVNFLLDHGASINGNVALRAALLCESQLDNSSEYWKNISPLYAALHAGQGEVAKLLIERGADISSLESDKLKALTDLAAEHGLLDVLKLLDSKALDDLEGFRFESGDTILTSAASRLDLDLVSRLLRNGMDVNAKNDGGDTALSCALWKNADLYKIMEMFKLLVSSGADINTKNYGLETPLHCAAGLHADDVARLLLELECEITCDDCLSYSPLHRAVANNHDQLTELLLQYGVDPNQKCERAEVTPLHVATESESVLAAQVLLQYGANIEATDVSGQTPLATAAEKDGGIFSMVQLLLGIGSNVHTTDKFGQTPLMRAVEHSYISQSTNVVETLLEHGSSVNATDHHGRSPLHFLCPDAQVEICELLLDHGANVNLPDDNGETPLHVAASCDTGIVESLLERGADVKTLDRENRTPLHAAAYEGDCESVELLIQHGSDVHLADSRGWLPLHFAAAGNNVDNAEILIENGSNIAAVDINGRSALYVAAKNGYRPMVEFMIDHESDFNARDFKGQTVLGAMDKCNWTEYRGWDVLEYYIENGGDVYAIDDATGRTTLHFAVTHQFVSTVDNLLDQGLELEARDKKGETPLHRAAASGSQEMIQHLVERGADLTAVNDKGQTPLLVSLANHKSNVLLKRGIDMSVADKYGNTALHFVVYNPRPYVDFYPEPPTFSVDDVRFLLKGGASVHCQDMQGNTPLHIASAEGRNDIAELLINHGSDVNATNVQGRTCLHMASYSGALDILQTLILHGAQVNAVDELGSTPLHIALTLGHHWLAEPLLRNGSDPEAMDYKGCTPLHASCCFDITGMGASIMIDHGR